MKKLTAFYADRDLAIVYIAEKMSTSCTVRSMDVGFSFKVKSITVLNLGKTA